MNFKRWLLLTEAKKTSDIALELVGNNKEIFNALKAIVPSDLKEPLRGKFLPIAAYFYQRQPSQFRINSNFEPLKADLASYANLVKKNKLPLIMIDDDLKSIGDPSYLSWTATIHAKQAAEAKRSYEVAGDVTGLTPMGQSTDGKIKVYTGNSPDLCIMLGKGEKFCISQAGNSQWQNYRDTKVSTFYFVYDKNRPSDDDLAIVVVDMNERRIELTDRKNDTNHTIQDPSTTTIKRIKADSNVYFNYLKSMGLDTSIFKNITRSKKEKEEHKKLGNQNQDTNWFMSLNPDEKSKYIGRGHNLSDKQFDFLFNNKLEDLLEQYVRIGRKVSKYQIDKIMTKPKLSERYFHNRMIAQRNMLDIGNYEYKVMGSEFRKELINLLKSRKPTEIDGNSDNSDLYQAILSGNISLVKTLVEKLGFDFHDNEVMKRAVRSGKQKMIDYWLTDQKIEPDMDEIDLWEDVVYEAISAGNINILKYIVNDKNFPIGEQAIDRAIDADKPSVEIVAFLINKGAPLTKDDIESAWFSRETRDIADYLDKVWIKRGN